jgi:hypothetical protein
MNGTTDIREEEPANDVSVEGLLSVAVLEGLSPVGWGELEMEALASSETKSAFTSPPSSLPTKSQFLRLWRARHNRKNFLFVGHEDAGENLAGLYSLVATCEANKVEPISYLTDVLGRLGSHPAAALDDLLPHKWRPSG